ncbi:MAG TPA: phosphotransferase [Terriglobales bacterium]|nr:phosphotransferase [Terriglobales bacterium]
MNDRRRLTQTVQANSLQLVDAPRPPQSSKLPLLCPECHTEVQGTGDRCLCPGCGACWPSVGGVPDFFHAEDYAAFDAELLAQIERCISEHPMLGSWDLELIGRHAASNSEVLEFRRRTQPDVPTLMLKHRRRRLSREASGNHARHEFQLLNEIWQRSDAAFRNTLPRPIALLPEIGAAVFQRVPGIPLSQFLKQHANTVTGPLHLPSLSATAASIGNWLHCLHSLNLAAATRHDGYWFLSALEYWLRKALRVGLEPWAAGEVWRAAARSAMTLDSLCPRSGTHGDFIPQNIFVRPADVAVIDFASYRNPNPIYEDLGLFVAYARLIATRWIYSHPALDEIVLAFLESYGSELNPHLLNLYVLKSTAMIFADQFSPQSFHPKDAVKRQRIQKHLLHQALIVSQMEAR